MYGRTKEYTNSIKGKEVEIGTLVGQGTQFGRVVRFTKTQIVCQHVRDDLTTPATNYAGKVLEFRLMKDDNGYGGGKLIGGRYDYYEVIDEEAARARIEDRDKERAIKNAKDAEREHKYQAAVAARKELMRPGYEARTLLSEELGLWQMVTVNENGDPVAIAWTVEERERFYEPDNVYIKLGFWYKSSWSGETQGPASTTASGPDELTALASRSYD